MISDGNDMRMRWDALISDMEQEDIDCLFMYSTDRYYSGYLRYVTDCPTIMFPLAGLFSKKGISIIGHGIKGTPLYPPPLDKQREGDFQHHAGGMEQHDFIKDLIGLTACPTTWYVPDLWAENIAELIKKYGYKRIGLVGLNIIPLGYVDYLKKNMPELEFTDATLLVDRRKEIKSAYEIELAEKCVWIIDELMAAAPSVMKVGMSLREVGRKMRRIADGMDCMDLNIMLGKHPTMPMFNEWPFTDEVIIKPDDCIEFMAEVSSNIGFWGECARIYSMGEPPDELVETNRIVFEMQDYLASLIYPGAIPSDVFAKYNKRLEEVGFPTERRMCCHGQGYDCMESPFVRPEIETPFRENAFIAVHPSMYDTKRKTGCFICDNYLITKDGARIMSKTPRDIIRVFNR